MLVHPLPVDACCGLIITPHIQYEQTHKLLVTVYVSLWYQLVPVTVSVSPWYWLMLVTVSVSPWYWLMPLIVSASVQYWRNIQVWNWYLLGRRRNIFVSPWYCYVPITVFCVTLILTHSGKRFLYHHVILTHSANWSVTWHVLGGFII